jgi:serine/threonine protein kinase
LKLFRLRGYRAEAVSSCGAATEKLNRKKYSVVLLDVKLPDMSGIDFFRQVKDRFEYTEFILITGYPDLETAVSMVKEGVFDYLSKPFDNANVLKKVNRAVKQRTKKLMDELEKTSCATSDEIYGFTPVREFPASASCEVLLVKRDGNYFVLKKFKNLLKGENPGAVREKFLQISAKAASIRHKNIINVLKYQIPENGAPYIVTEYVPGKPLADYIGNSELSSDRKTAILDEVLSALGAIHGADILHRDIKPANIIIHEKDMSVKVTDFGISCLLRKNYTETENLRGTPAYMAPESFGPIEKISTASDVFATGVLGYELFTGLRPFYGETILEFINSLQNDKPADPKVIIPEIPENVRKAIAGMLIKKPEERLSVDEARATLNGETRRLRTFGENVWS